MKKMNRKLKAAQRCAQHQTVQELRDLFEPWLRVPKNFAKGSYVRLFSPLTHLLALLVPGLKRRVVSPHQ